MRDLSGGTYVLNPDTISRLSRSALNERVSFGPLGGASDSGRNLGQIAGARVDRIAANAQANKAQIYHYFGSKDDLFDAVWEALVKQVVDEAPIDVDDLPGFAARLADSYAKHPDMARLITWQRLERGDDPPHAYAVESTRGNVAEIAAAQSEGRVSDRFEAGVLFGLIIHIAALWATSNPDVLAVMNVKSAKRRHEVVRDAVAALLA